LVYPASSEKSDIVGINKIGSVYKNISIRAGTGPSGINLLTDGNVGIGITSPDSLLHISSSAPVFKIERTGALAGNWSMFVSEDEAANRGSLYLRPSVATGNLAIQTSGGATQFYIDTSSGNVGIGTTTMTEKFNVLGNISFGPTDGKVQVQYNATELSIDFIIN